MSVKFTAAVATAVAAAVLAIGCGDDDDGNDGAGTAARTEKAGSAVAGLEGDYRRNMTEADIARTEAVRGELGPNQQRPEPGPLTLKLSEGTLKLVDLGARLTILQDFSATSDGAFRIGAYQRPDRGSFCGPDVSQTASYEWKLSGDALTLKATEDACADRDSSLSGVWKRR